jgi:predicted small lipoprotein YifL
VALSDRSLLSIALVVGLVAAMSLSACGRRGPLEAPPYATAIAGDPIDENGEPTPPKPDKPFFGDFLLDG